MELTNNSSEPTQPSPFHGALKGHGGGDQKIEIDFISQFLELPINQSSLHHQPTHHLPSNKYTKDASTQTMSELDSHPQNPILPNRNNSIFHNFQKHVVRTLKNHIKLKITHKGTPSLKLAQKMWHVFIQSHLYSKKILHFLFGVIHLTPEENYLQIRNYAIPKTETLLLAYSPQQVSDAQSFLREEVIRQGFRLLQLKGFSQRRMQNNEAFESYFLSFLQQLQVGPLNRRLPKSEKLLILQQSSAMKAEL